MMALEQSGLVYIAGHTGLIGSAFERSLRALGLQTITKSHAELELLDVKAVNNFFYQTRPSIVILAAGRVGGIQANMRNPAEFIFQNLAIQNNVIHSAYQTGVKHLLFFGSSCMYPLQAKQPFQEEALFSGSIEETSKPYATAKLTGVVFCRAYNTQYGTNFISIIPNTVYGPKDNFGQDSHVISALIQKMHDAKMRGLKVITLWGSGTPLREFLYVDDLVNACILTLNQKQAPDCLNVSSGELVSIRDLAYAVRDVVGYTGAIGWDTTRPDGAPRKSLDTQRIRSLGWTPNVFLNEGIQRTYDWFCQASLKSR